MQPLRLATAARACACALCLQFSVQYRVADERLYKAFFSLSNPASQVTSYGGWWSALWVGASAACVCSSRDAGLLWHAQQQPVPLAPPLG